MIVDFSTQFQGFIRSCRQVSTIVSDEGRSRQGSMQFIHPR